jgi:hypothetical protein
MEILMRNTNEVKSLRNSGLFVDVRLGGIPRYYLTPREDAEMRVPDEVRQCVVFIGVRAVMPSGHPGLSFQGTAFFVGIPSEKRAGQDFLYLVTAKHVADRLRGRELIVRANTRDGRSATIPSNGPVQWWYHPDGSVDVAVTSFGLSLEVFEYKYIPGEAFLSDQVIREKDVGVGDEVFIAGLFTQFSGNTKNSPIIRTGNIAMMPAERIPISDHETMEAYLIEARSISGISGSPVFVRKTISVGMDRIYLFGVVRGHWDILPMAKNDAVSVDPDVLQSVNVGIAIVTPAKKILEVLKHPELVAMRQRADQEAMTQHLPTADSSPEERETLISTPT